MTEHRPVYISPLYLRLLAEACELERIDFYRIDNFGMFLNDLKYALIGHGHRDMHDAIIREEVKVVSWGANSENAKGHG